MKPVDDELIAHIKESLSLHEEAYVPGAWENFNKKQKRKGGAIWLFRLGTAAAILFVGFAVFYMNRSPELVIKPTTAGIKADTSKLGAVNSVAVKSAPVKIAGQLADPLAVVGKPTQSAFIVMPKPAASTSGSVPSEINNPVPVLTHSTDGSKPQDPVEKPSTDVVAPKEVLIAKVPAEQSKKQSFQDFLNAETEKNKNQPAKNAMASKTESKWDLGLMVAPSIGNDKKINMGYGVSMEYAVSKKVSISSGVSYNQMGALKTIMPDPGVMNNPAAAVALVQETKKLKSVDANLVGLDIPLELKYHFNDRFYTNVGLSAFAVLNQKQNNNYVEGKVETSSSSFVDRSAFNSLFKESAVSEPVPSDEVRNDKYLGFYNLSIGYKQKVSGKNSLSIEPFMKLPIKEYSKENLRLIGTGVRLKFDF